MRKKLYGVMARGVRVVWWIWSVLLTVALVATLAGLGIYEYQSRRAIDPAMMTFRPQRFLSKGA